MLKRGAAIDRMFQALADPTRRAIVERLSEGPASVSELARPLRMSLPAMAQHLAVLEASGLVQSTKTGRVRMCRLRPQAFGPVDKWIAERLRWEARFGRLGAILARDEMDKRRATMTERSVAHGSFTVKRSYAAAPSRVFGAFADPKLKGKWYGDPVKESEAEVFEFRVGGREYRAGDIPDGPSYAIDIRYYDIVENQRIVFAYEILIDGERMSVSVVAVEFRPEGAGTLLTLTEQGTFLDGHEKPEERQGGAEFTLDRLEKLLAGMK